MRGVGFIKIRIAIIISRFFLFWCVLLREICRNVYFLWSVFSRIWTKLYEMGGYFSKDLVLFPPTMLGDVSHKRSVGQIPRGPQDMYNVRPSVPSEKVDSTKNSVVKLEPFGCYLLFSINHSGFYVLSDDPTLNVLKDMILLTVTVHKNLKLLKKRKLENPQYLLDPCYCIKIVSEKCFQNLHTVL